MAVFDKLRSYQILTLLGGILGLIIVSFALMTVFVLSRVLENMGPMFSSSVDQSGTGYLMGAGIVTMILYIIAIVLAFGMKNTEDLGKILIVFAVVSLILVSFYGVLGFALILAGGIAAWKSAGKIDNASQSTLNVLKKRYAKGEITKEEFEQMKEDLADS